MTVAMLLGLLVTINSLLCAHVSAHGRHTRPHLKAAAPATSKADGEDNLEATAVLMSLMRDVKAQQEVDGRLADSMEQWCKDAQDEQVSMASKVKRQLDESAIALKQLEADEQRIRSELSLTESTQKQKEQHLQDSISTANLALEEFNSEQNQVSQAESASQELLELMKNQESQDASKAAGSWKTLESSLSDMGGRLGQEKQASLLEHQEISQKLWTFSDRLNSSIMETRSQSAAISMELSHQKREQALIEEKKSEYTNLLEVARAGLVRTKEACSAGAERISELSKLTSWEVSQMQSMWQVIAPAVADTSEESQQKPAPSFLQARRVVNAPDNSGSDADSDSERDPIEGIKQFVESASSSSDAQSNKALAISPDSSSSLVIKGQDELSAGQNRSEWSKYCMALTRDASIDAAAIDRSLKRLDAKLKLVQAAQTEQEHNAAYFKAQQTAFQGQVKKLAELSDAEAERHNDAATFLGRASDKLAMLVNSMTSEASETQSSSTGTALLESMQKRRSLMENDHVVFQRDVKGIEAANSAVQRLLAKDVENTQRRLLQFKAEAQVLAALVDSKKQDQARSVEFHENAKKLCDKA